MESNPKLSKQTLKEIEKARKRINSGQYFSSEQIKSRLGIWMSYSIKWDKKALLFLEKLDKNIAKRIFDKIEQSKENPDYFYAALSNSTASKLRVGDYWAIADINYEIQEIHILLIGHRKNVYDKL